ncbi:NifB/NifX family molybdenum-iron cluster-binding protein [Thalassobellus citreus]|uniref:NifB/NifX family molybdenum-iron cluster-binding protein n=1 Tax=Thalassobellus citreus TaxID=3367752 RepID=UPI0037A2F067
MNIIIPVIDDNKGKYTIAKGFHNTEYTCVFNSLNSSFEWIKTKEISNMDDNLSLALKRKGIYSIITSHMPYLALRLFKESGLTIYKSKGKNVEENIELYLTNELQSFTPQIHFGTSNYSACGSCSANSNSCGSDCS